MSSSALVWFRRDLRFDDHAALSYALQRYERVFCAFIFDTDILDELPQRHDRRVEFILDSVTELHATLCQHKSSLLVRLGSAGEEIPALATQLDVDAVVCNRDYEPDAIARDADIARKLQQVGIDFKSLKDQVIFDHDDLLTQSGKPFGMYAPYKRKWLSALTTEHLAPYPIQPYLDHIAPVADSSLPSLEKLGFKPTDLHALNMRGGTEAAWELFNDFTERIGDYKTTRDYPAINGTSLLSVHLRFGTISIRQLVQYAWKCATYEGNQGAETWLSELIWREFYQQVLYHRPDTVNHAYQSQFDHVKWVDDEALFQAWCDARTGYPIVDAAMRQLNDTGFMHNRLRMIAASFLSKDLGIHWLKGERYFAQQLNDYDLAANIGGWQWSASTGCNAQPWFRIFNPVLQSQRFDPKGDFIRRFIPELKKVPDRFIHTPWMLPPLEQDMLGITIGKHYPLPLVDHAIAKEASLYRFRTAAKG